MKTNKSFGLDNIMAEMLEYGGVKFMEKIQNLYKRHGVKNFYQRNERKE